MHMCSLTVCKHWGAGRWRRHASVWTHLGPSVGWSAELSQWGLLLWADKLLVVSDTWEQALARCRAYEERLAGIDLKLSPGSLEALANVNVPWAPKMRRPPMFSKRPDLKRVLVKCTT